MTRWTTQAIDDALEAIRGAGNAPEIVFEPEQHDPYLLFVDVEIPGYGSVTPAEAGMEWADRADGYRVLRPLPPATGTGYEAALLALGRVVALEAKCRAMSTTLLDGTVEQRMCESFARSLRCALEGDDDDR